MWVHSILSVFSLSAAKQCHVLLAISILMNVFEPSVMYPKAATVIVPNAKG